MNIIDFTIKINKLNQEIKFLPSDRKLDYVDQNKISNEMDYQVLKELMEPFKFDENACTSAIFIEPSKEELNEMVKIFESLYKEVEQAKIKLIEEAFNL